jgi:transposase
VKAEPGPPPRFVGVDDWAIRKGQRYGTILIDLERSCVIDVFPGRDGEALREWLRANPHVEVIARDRWAAYAKAATDGAPQAKQVADRWHLLKNLREAIERLFARYSPEILKAMSVVATAASPADEGTSTAPIDTANSPTPTAKVRQERHFQVRRLHSEGHSIRSIASQTSCSRKAVCRYLADGKCPDWSRGRRPASQLDEHRQAIEAWIVEGGRCWTHLYRSLKPRGLSASYDALRRYVRGRYGNKLRPDPRTKAPKPPSTKPKPTPPTARSLSFKFIRLPKEPPADAAPTMLEQLRKQIPGLNKALDLASEFARSCGKKSTNPSTNGLRRLTHPTCEN